MTSGGQGYGNEKPMEERLAKVHAAIEEIKVVLADDRRFKNECEEVFSRMRLPCVHLRRDREAMDAVEGKDLVWQFLQKLCKERPILRDRCDEVCKILLMSDKWKEELKKLGDLDDLPDSVKDEVDPTRAKDKDMPKETPRGKKDPTAQLGAGQSMNIVVQRCTSAKLHAEPSPASIERGLLISVSFGPAASNEKIQSVAKSLLTAKLAGVGDSPASIVELCRKGEAQGILVIPQKQLGAQFDEDGGIKYANICSDASFQQHYATFTASLQRHAEDLIPVARRPQISTCNVDAHQGWEVRADGFMHSFSI